jgi:carboxyl-terminal processing protease
MLSRRSIVKKQRIVRSYASQEPVLRAKFAKETRSPSKLEGGISSAFSAVLANSTLVLSLLVIIFCCGTYAFMNHPLQIYWSCWKQVKDDFYDKKRLVNWDSFEHKYDSKIWTDQDAIKYSKEMLATLHDPYTRILPVSPSRDERKEAVVSRGYYDDCGFGVGKNDRGHIVVSRVIHGSSADKAGLKCGDELKGINGKNTDKLSALEVLELAASSSKVTLDLRREKKASTVNMILKPVFVPTVKARMLPERIGYIRIEHFCDEDAGDSVESTFHNTLSGAKAIVLDLRGNPGGRLINALEVCSIFMKQGRFTTMESSDVTNFDVASSEITSWTDGATGSLVRHKYSMRNRPLAVLIDRDTASAAEASAACISQNHAGFTVGERTFGKGIGQETIELPRGHILSVSDIRVWTPRGQWLGDGNKEKYGLEPDIKCSAGTFCKDYGDADDSQLRLACRILSGTMRKFR